MAVEGVGDEANKSNSAATPRLGQWRKKHVVRAVMHPTRSTVPSMAVAVHQGGDVDKTQIEMLAEQARFVTDPAQRPTGGHFAITLYFDSTVTLQIWSGNVARGTPVFQAQSHNVQAGGNRVPWDLHTKSGYAAPGSMLRADVLAEPGKGGPA